jgi:hypothetical protein
MDSDYDKHADNNALRIRDEVQSLDIGHWRIPHVQRNYADFWRHAKEISNLFKELKPLRRKDREELWSKFSSTCDELKASQNKTSFNRQSKSEDYRNDIRSEISAAKVNDFFGFDSPDIEEMKRLSRVLKGAREKLSRYKNEMIAEHKRECYEDIQEVQRQHDAWWEDLKGHRAQKHQEYLDRVRANLDKNREKLIKATSALESCKYSADDLRGKINDSYNDDWETKARGWLAELEEKIEDIEGSIERLEGWIAEDEEKLGEVDE